MPVVKEQNRKISDTLLSPEYLNPRSIAVVTTTFYPTWYPGEVRGKTTPDKIRGDLALQTITEAKKRAHQLVVIDGTGASTAFREATS